MDFFSESSSEEDDRDAYSLGEMSQEEGEDFNAIDGEDDILSVRNFSEISDRNQEEEEEEEDLGYSESYSSDNEPMKSTRFQDKSSIKSSKEEEEDESNEFDARESIEDILRCPICFGRVQNAHMCPSCSKICCETCIKRWITEQKPQCPHCRSTLFIEQLIPCRFFSDVSAELDKISKLSAFNNRKKEEECKIHNAPLYYYCVTDGVSICSDCAMFDKNHAGHNFQHLKTVYKNHVEMVENEAAMIRKKLRELSSLISTVDSNIQSVMKAKEERANEMKTAFSEMFSRLESQLNVKWTTLKAQRKTMAEEMSSLNSILQQVDQSLGNPRQAEFIEKSEQLVSLIREIQVKPIGNFTSVPVSNEFDNEITPPWDSLTFKLNNFNRIREEELEEIVWSETLFANGLLWRLKVYPNGNGVARGHYISVFLQMQQGLRETSKYQYKVEMINAKNSQLNVVREFASDFEEGECWGYNRFYQIDLLNREGFVSIDNDQSIQLKFHVRPLTYFQLARDQRRCIRQLQEDRAEILVRERTLQLQVEELLRNKQRSNSSGSTGENSKLKILQIPEQNTNRNLSKVHRNSSPQSKENNRGILAQSDGNLVGNRREHSLSSSSSSNPINFHSNSLQNFTPIVSNLPIAASLDSFTPVNPNFTIPPRSFNGLGATIMGGTYDGSSNQVIPSVPFNSTSNINVQLSPTPPPFSTINNPTLDYNSINPTPFINVLNPGNAPISGTRSSSSLDLEGNNAVSLGSDRDLSPASTRRLHRSWTATEFNNLPEENVMNSNVIRKASPSIAISPNGRNTLPGATFEELSPRSGGPILFNDNSVASDDLERDRSIVSVNNSFNPPFSVPNNDARFMNASIEWLDEQPPQSSFKLEPSSREDSNVETSMPWAQSSDLRDNLHSNEKNEENEETDYDFEPLEDYKSSAESEEGELTNGKDWRFQSQGDFSLNSPQREEEEEFVSPRFSPPARETFEFDEDGLNNQMLDILMMQKSPEGKSESFHKNPLFRSQDSPEDDLNFLPTSEEGRMEMITSNSDGEERTESSHSNEQKFSQDFGQNIVSSSQPESEDATFEEKEEDDDRMGMLSSTGIQREESEGEEGEEEDDDTEDSEDDDE
eukprot:TRINITY_DN356_c0_g1_i3.p1 TRINITY_DN356_c0_g1~~TRINITY_DN356_c0_g1_i3.p1  ORF type:complete len:1116 (-),score=495.45 TRINITY_DN356_c0_g1_i3:155-3502(-)